MRTCVHHGEESGFAPSYRCDLRPTAIYCGDEPGGAEGLPCFVPLPAAAPEPEKVPDSTPVTFADVLRYHRQRADDWRSADRPWHEEAVDCLVYWGTYFCQSCGAEYDKYGCTREKCGFWQARKAVGVEG